MWIFLECFMKIFFSNLLILEEEMEKVPMHIEDMLFQIEEEECRCANEQIDIWWKENYAT
jgi:hypothetical protein